MSTAHSSCRFRFANLCFIFLLSGCAGFGAYQPPAPPAAEQPRVAIVNFGLGVKIRKVSSIKTVPDGLSEENAAALLANSLRDITADARSLIHERLSASGAFALVSLKETDYALEDLQVPVNGPLDAVTLKRFRDKLGVDVVVKGTVLDYGKVRWTWMAAGMLGDMTWESIAIGLATAWNPAAMLGNIGFEILTSTPVWFGGGYLFGAAFRPVRVEAEAVDTLTGERLWNETSVAVLAWRRLRNFPVAERVKKEVQLRVNLESAMKELGDSLVRQDLTKTSLQNRRRPDQDPDYVVSF